MAVICACIPSLRPLISLGARRLRGLSSFTKSSVSSNSGKRRWPGAKGSFSDGTFSQLSELPEDMKRLGHDVTIHGGQVTDPEAGGEAIELPQHGIQVRTEIR
ncbi:MAG: hypothetical protein Q9222_006383, partial [Ikaeria aurantiellina]